MYFISKIIGAPIFFSIFELVWTLLRHTFTEDRISTHFATDFQSEHILSKWRKCRIFCYLFHVVLSMPDLVLLRLAQISPLDTDIWAYERAFTLSHATLERDRPVIDWLSFPSVMVYCSYTSPQTKYLVVTGHLSIPRLYLHYGQLLSTRIVQHYDGR